MSFLTNLKIRKSGQYADHRGAIPQYRDFINPDFHMAMAMQPCLSYDTNDKYSTFLQVDLKCKCSKSYNRSTERVSFIFFNIHP